MSKKQLYKIIDYMSIIVLILIAIVANTAMFIKPLTFNIRIHTVLLLTLWALIIIDLILFYFLDKIVINNDKESKKED